MIYKLHISDGQYFFIALRIIEHRVLPVFFRVGVGDKSVDDIRCPAHILAQIKKHCFNVFFLTNTRSLSQKILVLPIADAGVYMHCYPAALLIKLIVKWTFIIRKRRIIVVRCQSNFPPYNLPVSQKLNRIFILPVKQPMQIHFTKDMVIDIRVVKHSALYQIPVLMRNHFRHFIDQLRYRHTFYRDNPGSTRNTMTALTHHETVRV